MNMPITRPEIDRVAWIRRRRLEIAATLAQWKYEYFADPRTERPMVERTRLEAEAAALALEERDLKEAAVRARIAVAQARDRSTLAILRSMLTERGMAALVAEAEAQAQAATEEGASHAG